MELLVVADDRHHANAARIGGAHEMEQVLAELVRIRLIRLVGDEAANLVDPEPLRVSEIPLGDRGRVVAPHACVPAILGVAVVGAADHGSVLRCARAGAMRERINLTRRSLGRNGPGAHARRGRNDRRGLVAVGAVRVVQARNRQRHVVVGRARIALLDDGGGYRPIGDAFRKFLELIRKYFALGNIEMLLLELSSKRTQNPI